MLVISNCVRWVVLHTAMSQEVVVIVLNSLIIIVISAHLYLVPRLRMIGAVPPRPCMPCGLSFTYNNNNNNNNNNNKNNSNNNNPINFNSISSSNTQT